MWFKRKKTFDQIKCSPDKIMLIDCGECFGEIIDAFADALGTESEALDGEQ